MRQRHIHLQNYYAFRGERPPSASRRIYAVSKEFGDVISVGLNNQWISPRRAIIRWQCQKPRP